MNLPFLITSEGKLSDRLQDIFGLSSSKFKAKLAAAMAAPIRRSLDYHGIARRALFVEPLPQGALPFYEKDKVEAVENKVFAERVTVPEFEIYQNPVIKISEVKARRFNLIGRDGNRLIITPRGKLVGERVRRRFTVIDRAVEKARQEILEREDRQIFKMLDALGEEGK